MANVHYRINEAAVLSFLAPGQPVNEEVVWKTAQFTRDFAKLEAPKRTGKLAASIRASRPRPAGLYQLSSSVSVAVGYGHWVHEGTEHLGLIYPKRGKYLTVPHVAGPLSGAALKASGGSGRAKLYFLARFVRGQKPNPFLADALKKALATNDVLQYRV